MSSAQQWIYNLSFILLLHPIFTKALSSSEDKRAFGWDLVNFIIILIVILNIIIYKIRKLQEAKNGEKEKIALLSAQQICRHFSLAEIQLATCNFDDKCLIGKGGSAKVYKGVLDNGLTTVAIKRLSFVSQIAGGSAFWTEIEMVSKFRHNNLVSLIGYCDEFHEMILVFEYVPSGTLADHLHTSSRESHNSLSWIQRLRICIGAARGLDYLHTGAGVHQRVIHRDVKSTNILLDDDLEAKIADFGISKLVAANLGCSYVSTLVRGTFGYMDPAYFSTGRLSRKSDVYAFGVVLFEVLCGRRAVDLSRDDVQSSLAGWAQHFINEGRVDEIIAPNLKTEILQDSLSAFVKAAYQCLNSQPRCRPTMAEIVVVLEFALALQVSPNSTLVKGTVASDHSHSSIAAELVYGMDQANPFQMAHTRTTISRKVCQILLAPIRVLSVCTNAKHLSYSINNTTRDGNKVRLNKIGIIPEANNRMKLNQIVPRVKGLSFSADLRMFSLAELSSITRGFSPDMMLGEAYGKVFIGWVDEDTFSPSRIGIGMAVAIARYEPGGYERYRALETEVDLCGKFNHPNLLKLLGFCLEGEEFFLVYEHMTKGALDRYAYRDNGKSLSWVVWLKILIGAARYLALLHTSVNPVILCDFRPYHILLDEDFNAKIVDTGRARFLTDSDMLVTSTPPVYAEYCPGSESYFSPEYIEAGRLSTKNDVYAFGVVLLEILTGRHVTEINKRKRMNLVDKARPVLASQRKVKTILNPKLLEEKYCPQNLHAILSAIPSLALKCLDNDPEERPSMIQVVNALEELNAIIK